MRFPLGFISLAIALSSVPCRAASAQPGFVAADGTLDITGLTKSAQINPADAVPSLPQNNSINYNKPALVQQAVQLADQQTDSASTSSKRKRDSESPYVYGPNGCGTRINTTTTDPSVPQNVSAATFSSNPILNAMSLNRANPPPGYATAYFDRNGTYTSQNGVNSYLTMQTLGSYDVQSCANACRGMSACRAFNIYFERDPSVDVQDPAIDPSYAGQYHPSYAACNDPPALTNIVCTYWSSFVSAAGATNTGQYRGSTFQVREAGSNGYNLIASPQTYSDTTSTKTYAGIVSAKAAAQMILSASMNSNVGADSTACHKLATTEYKGAAASFSSFDVTSYPKGADTSKPSQGRYAGTACIVYGSNFAEADFSNKGTTGADGTFYAYGPVYHYSL